VGIGRGDVRLPKFVLAVAAVAASCLCLASQAAEPAAKHFLWTVTGGKGTVYLLGTIHIGSKDLYPLAPIIEDSFKRSDTLVEEIDLGGGDAKGIAQDLIKRGLYADGDTIANHLSEDTRTALAAYAKSGQLSAGYTQAKPWLVSLMIMQLQLKDMGLDKAKGLDLHFSEEAAELHKPVAALETADSQIKTFSSFSDELQDQLLLTTLLDAKKAKDILDSTFAAWRAGDADALEKVITAEVREHPSLAPLMDKLFDERNDAMAQQVDEFLQTPKTYFVAVGAGHLVGKRGLLGQLRDKGYAVEQQ